MHDDLEAAALALLEAAPELPLSLAALHRALAGRFGPEAGSAEALLARLRERPDHFIVIDDPFPACIHEGWPPDVRDEYQAALRGAGVEPGPRISPAPRARPATTASGPDRLLGAVARSLTSLADGARPDPRSRRLVREEAAEFVRLQHALRARRPAAHPGG
jgi:hypothetical protein